MVVVMWIGALLVAVGAGLVKWQAGIIVAGVLAMWISARSMTLKIKTDAIEAAKNRAAAVQASAQAQAAAKKAAASTPGMTLSIPGGNPLTPEKTATKKD